MTKKILFFTIVLLSLTACDKKQEKLIDLVNYNSVWNHLEAFDKIAKENSSNRAVGTPGGIASKNYIIDFLKNLGLTPIAHDFTNRSGAQGSNLTVDIKGKLNGDVVLIGAHYDSVVFGPGINDNASGVAILIEIIEEIQKAGIMPDKTLRFAFWDSEETGVEGSAAYYNVLSEDERKQITAYLNVDMVASIDGEIQISDTDGSTVQEILDEAVKNGVEAESIEMLKAFYGAMKFAPGSEKLEQLTKDAFAQLNIEVVEDLTFAMNSDTGPFFAQIPTIGITVVKETTEPTEDGGEILSFAPCYHQACDDISNIDKRILESCLKAVAIIVQQVGVDYSVSE